MKSIAALMTWLLLAVSVLAASSEGEVTLPYTSPKAKPAPYRVEFGGIVKASCAWQVGEYYGWQTIFGGAVVKNTGSKPMWVQYCVAFYDRDKKLVGTASQSVPVREGLPPGKSKRLTLCRIILPRDRYKDITSYQATLYEIDTPPLARKGSILLEDPETEPR